MSSGKKSSDIPEAGYFNQELKLQYEDKEPIPLTIERYMMKETVNKVKEALIKSEALCYVRENPEDLKMYMVLPGTNPGEGEPLQEMDGNLEMWKYSKELSRCNLIKLLKEPHGATPLNLGYIHYK